MRSGMFHLTHYRDLKDNDELTWAFNQYDKITSHLFYDEFNFLKFLPDEFYVMCTCKKNNNKYLWENYASSNNVDYSGICIGIDAQALYFEYNIRIRNIDMAPMEYNPEAYTALCKKSVEGLKPIGFPREPIKIPTNCTPEYRKALLHRIPGYKEYEATRDEALSRIIFQKGKDYIHENELRIFHSDEYHRPLSKIVVGEKRKALLRWRNKKHPLIKEVLRTPQCLLSERKIKDILRANKVDADVVTLSPYSFT